MNRENLYNKTVDILYNAYFNDTLEHANCSACAVGNLVAANLGYSHTRNEEGFLVWKDRFSSVNSGWAQVFSTCIVQEIKKDKYTGEAKKQIDSTGYTWRELARIEYAFESVKWTRFNSGEHMFNGLVAVLEVIKTIHQVEDNTPEVTRFRQYYTSKTVLCQ